MPRKPSRRQARKTRSGRSRSNSQLHRSQARRQLLLECLEPRIVLTGIPLAAGEGEGSISLSLFVDGQQTVLPANIGVQADDSRADTFTVGTQGEIFFTPDSGLTLDSFFDTWRTAAGLAGNNPDSSFTVQELLGNSTDSTHLVKMFVNGQVSLDYENYVLQDGDSVSIVHTDKPVTSLNTNVGSLLVELFETDTPGTIDNFLNYVNDGDYINSFFHRSVPGFVIQGGGFTTTSTTFTNTGQFSSVPTDPPIVNEPGISNTRGTIAMAKTSNPDSATSQFFVNLNNNTALDSPSNSGGFTAFGRILDMTVSDTIASFPVVGGNLSPFGELPLNTGNQLTVIESVAGHGELVGEKFLDRNANGIRDAGEEGIANEVIFVDANGNSSRDPGELFTLTDANGNFRMAIAPGTHSVLSEVPSEANQTIPVLGYSATVAIGRDTIGLVFGITPLSAPSGIDLVASSDTGSSDVDNLTSLNNSPGNALQFDIAGAIAGAEVFLFVDGVSLGSVVADSSTVTVTTDTLTTLDDGVRSIEAVQANNAGQSPLSLPFEITIDTVAPGLVDNIPVTAQAGVVYSFDAVSSDDGIAPTTFGLVNPPAGMTIDSATGVASWTPTSEQAVPQTLILTATDSAGNTSTLQKNLTVLLAIQAFPESYAATEDTTLTVDVAQGVLANDDGSNASLLGPLTAQLVTPPTNGSLTLDPDGSFSYVPDANFNGDDSFTYRATDGSELSNVALVSISVAPTDDLPLTSADAYTVDEDVVLTVDAANGVLANDSDIDGDQLTATAVQQPTNGTLVLSTDGSFVYTPNQNFFGGDTFTYTVNDGTTTTSEVMVGVTVNAVNDVPVVGDDTYAVVEDTPLVVAIADGVLANDSDVESSLTASIVTAPTSGSVSFNSDGTFTYTPNANFFGTDSFTYAASDGTESVVATATLNVAGTPDAPVAVGDNFAATNGGLQFTFNVLENDTTEPDGLQQLSISAVTNGSQGGTIASLGNAISYTANIGFVGEESFSYTVTDVDGLTSTAEVVITVREQANSTITGRVFLDFNNNGVYDANEIPFQGAQVTITGTPQFGAAVSRSILTDANGVFSFPELPAGTYRLQQNQPAGAVDGLAMGPGSGIVIGSNSLSNIVLADNEVLTGFQFSEQAIKPEFVNITWLFASRLPLQNSVVNAVANAEEQAGNTVLANNIRASITIAPPPTNAAPTAFADTYQVDMDVALVIPAANGVLANDSDPEQDALSISVINQPSNGSVVVAADGGFTYTPNAAFTGQDTFTYQLSDGQALSNTATVAIDVRPVIGAATFTVNESVPNGTSIGSLSEPNAVLYQIAPANSAPALALRPDDHLSGNLAGSVVLIEYVDLQCPACRAFAPIVSQLEQDFANDLLVVTRHFPLSSVHANALQAAVAAEAAGRQGEFDAMHDLMFDRQAQWNTLTDPTAFFESLATELGLNLTQFQSDVADTTLLDRVNRDLADAGTLGLNSTPSFFLGGAAISTPSSEAAFRALVQGEVDSLTDPFRLNRSTGEFTVRDTTLVDFATQTSHSLSVIAADASDVRHDVQVTINVTEAVGASPIAVDDAYSVDEGTVLEVQASSGVLSNDTDADGDILTASVVTNPSNGSLALLSTGQFVYTPAANFTGDDSFTYQVSDGELTDTATVTISVIPNAAPVANDDAYNVDEDATLTVSAGQGLLNNDTDPDGDALAARIISLPTNGTLTLNLSGAFNYTPNADFNGTDTFTYRASDGLLDSTSAATVSITVTPVADAPIAARDEYHTDPNQTLVVSAADGVLHNDSDGDGDSIMASIVTGAANGGVALNADGSFSYVPGLDFVGDDSFIYEVTDGALVSQTTVDVSVTTNDLASFRVETTTISGAALSSVSVGETFLVRVFANDERTNGVGVEAAFLDLLFDTNLVTLDSNVAFDPLFTNSNVDTSVDGRLDEFGGSRTDLVPSGNSESLLASMVFRASAVGTSTFTTDPADESPIHDTLLLRDPIAIDVDQIFFGSTAIEIVAGAGGEPSDLGFTDSVDEIMAELGE